MKFTKVFALIGAFALIALLPQAKADEWNQKTVFTFSGPVEIPGQVLSPGHMCSNCWTPWRIGTLLRCTTSAKITCTEFSWQFRTIA